MQNNISKLLKQKGFKVPDVASKLGVTPGHFFKLKSGKQRLNTDQIAKLAEIFGCLPQDIISDQSEDVVLAGQAEEVLSLAVPIIRSIPDNGIKDKLEAAVIGYLPHKSATRSLFAIAVETDSLNLLAPVGSLIIVDYSVKSLDLLDNKTVMAFTKDDGQVLRKFKRNPDRLEAYSSKPQETIYIQNDDWHIIGKVVGVVTNLEEQ